MEKLGVEKIEKLVDALGHVIIAGKKVTADKKVDLNDLPAIMELLMKVPAIVDAFKQVSDVWLEVKDVDVDEAIQLIVKINAKVKEIEAA
jgi:hypothetical protein